MSYTIIRSRFVAKVTKKDPEHASRTEHKLLFVQFDSSSNVRPPDIGGHVIAQDETRGQSAVSRWGKEVMLPKTLWELAHYADGGDQKLEPGHNVSGTAYIRQWKKLAEHPIDIESKDKPGTIAAPFRPEINIHLPKVARELVNEGKAPEFLGTEYKWYNDEAAAAFDAIFKNKTPKLCGFYGYITQPIETVEQLLNALALRRYARRLKDHGSYEAEEKDPYHITTSLEWPEISERYFIHELNQLEAAA